MWALWDGAVLGLSSVGHDLAKGLSHCTWLCLPDCRPSAFSKKHLKLVVIPKTHKSPILFTLRQYVLQQFRDGSEYDTALWTCKLSKKMKGNVRAVACKGISSISNKEAAKRRLNTVTLGSQHVLR